MSNMYCTAAFSCTVLFAARKGNRVKGTGRGGSSKESLGERWEGGPRGEVGTEVPGFH